jgi:hypothetical protein
MGRHCNRREAGAPSIRTRYIAGMTRYLLIAGGIYFLLLAVALIGLWIRGYSLHDHWTYGGHRSILFGVWFLAATSFALAALFAFKNFSRFTTRELLFAATVVALVLGLGFYLLQR